MRDEQPGGPFGKMKHLNEFYLLTSTRQAIEKKRTVSRKTVVFPYLVSKIKKWFICEYESL